MIASLWKVGDAETQAIMARFYQNLWTNKMPKLEALRDAQLRFLRGELDAGTSLVARGPGAIAPRPDPNSDGKTEPKRPRVPPRAWAAWVLSGDWR